MSGGVLNFSLPRPDWLNFGREALYGHDLTLTGVLSPPAGNFQFTVITNHLTLAGVLAPPDGVFQFFRSVRLESSSGIRWQTAHPYRTDRATPLPSTAPITVAISITDQAGTPIAPPIAAAWTAGQSVTPSSVLSWTSGNPQTARYSLAWTSGNLTPMAHALSWTQGQQALVGAALRYEAAQLTPGVTSIPFVTAMPRIAPAGKMAWASGVLWAHEEPLRHQQAMRPPRGWRIVPYPRPPSTKHEGRLNFVCPWPNDLNFGLKCLGSALMYPAIRRSYRVINSASLIRVSDSADIPCSSITIKLDRDSWAWSLSATLLGEAAHDLIPAYPGKVRATLNGFIWDFVIDDLRYSRAFGRFSATVSGRSPAAVMATPYAATRHYKENLLHTAQQLALQELVSGWQLDWAETLVDWTVPAKTFEYQGLAPIESICRIVKAAGGWVYADPTESVLHATPRWPAKPWDWTNAVPEISLPSSYTLTEERNAETGAEYDFIIVSGGTNNGVCVLVTRAGMPGTYPANAVVDSLITDITAAQARAVQEIADTWPLRRYRLSLPLQAHPDGAGLLMPGTIFDFVDGELDGWRGLVTGVSLSASRNSIRQDLEIVAP